MKIHIQTKHGTPKSGVAMIAVLVILLAIFALCAPFLMSVRNADRASAELTNKASARLALDSALRHARAQLGASHAGVDTTPYYDSLDEFDVRNDFAGDFYNASDPKGVMWGVDVDDLAGLIDLNSVSHHTMANLMGGVARTAEATEKKSRQIEVSSAAGFAPAGFFWIREELVGYAKFENSRFKDLKRGVLYEEPEEGESDSCGPGKPSDHPLGSSVIDQRSFALPLWRMFSGSLDELALLDSLEQVNETKPFTMIGELPPGFLETLQRTSTVHGHVGAGSKWQNQTRLLRQLDSEDKPSCRFQVQDTRFMNAGSTVRISDGQRVEFAIVREVDLQEMILMDALVNVYDPQRTTISVLARRPVNINTASVEVLHALMVNLRLTGKRARITSREATQLVEVIVESRPFTSFEDFVSRVVLPAGGFRALPSEAPVVPKLFAGQGASQSGPDGSVEGFIDEDDARALYKNARNANDRELEFSTMPFSFTSRDLYSIEMRASVNARSGVERAHRVRTQTDLIVPQKPLFKLWHRQEDFDEQSRLDRAAPGWVTGPEPTARSAGRFPSRAPSRSLAHLGNFDSEELTTKAREEGTPAIQTFASREGDAWLQMAPARTPEAQGQSNVLHFDYETESLEGHYLPDGILTYNANQSPVQFTGTGPSSAGTSSVVLPSTSAPPVSGVGGLMNAVSFEMWIKPQALGPGSTFLSAGGGFGGTGSFGVSDMVELILTEQDLVLRVRDGLPDHMGTPDFKEVAEVRYPINEGAGLPLDVWTHVSARVSGTRPDQMQLIVDGRVATETIGLTRLSSSLSSDSTVIPVESTEHFPNECVLIIGEELIEATKSGPNSFEAIFKFEGRLAGFGGRLARETYGGRPEINRGLPKQTSYAQGTTVQLYGYSLPLAGEVSSLRGMLSERVGAFAVARAVGVIFSGSEYIHVPDTGSGQGAIRPAITVGQAETEVGYGLPGSATVEEILLQPADVNVPLATMLEAFSPSGGYALITARTRSFNTSIENDLRADTFGSPFGGIEVIRYSGVSAKGLILQARGNAIPELELDPDLATPKSFIFHLNEDVFLDPTFAPEANARLTAQTFVIPISIPVSGSVPLPAPPSNPSELIQLTHVGADAGQTEWVRYDIVARGAVVRTDPIALAATQLAVLGGQLIENPADFRPNDPDEDPRLPSGGDSSIEFDLPIPIASPTPAFRVPRQQQQSGAFWHYAMGQPDMPAERTPVTNAVASHLQFRGVMGTFSHVHEANTLVLPVFRLPSGGVQRGMPGRLDQVMLFEQVGTGPSRGVPRTVHRAHRSYQYLTHNYQDAGVLMGSANGSSAAVLQDPSFRDETLVALDNFTSAIGSPNNAQANTRPAVSAETRSVARMSKFPAGELPRAVESVSLGGSFSGVGTVASAEIDEVAFGRDRLTHQKILDNDVGVSAGTLRVRGHRYPGGDDITAARKLSGMRSGSGLIRIGDEVMAYNNLDTGSDRIMVSELGRGLLGSVSQSHAAGEGITWMENYSVGMLAAGLDAEKGILELGAGSVFPVDGGLVLVGRELIHYTRFINGRLEMPSASEEPGERDGRGAGLFRGRFGTDAVAHPAGTPAILFPFRYWDRWAHQADAPELDFFEFSLDQPGAYLGSVFWDLKEDLQAGVRLGVLQRLGDDAPWDQDPFDGNGLDLMYRGRMKSGGNVIGAQAGKARWRAFAEYERGAFDPDGGLSHGWKTTPRLKTFGVEYVAPGFALQRIER